MSEIVEILMPSSQQEGTESVVSSWFKKVGDTVKENEPLLEISTDKVMVEIPSPASGVLREIIKADGASIEIGELLGTIEISQTLDLPLTENVARLASTSTAPANAPRQTEEQRLSPAVRKLVEMHKVDLTKVKGSGAGGRITTKDIEDFVAKPAEKTIASEGAHFVKHTPMRKSIANHMVQSLLKTAPHVTALFEADMSAVIKHRAQHKAAFSSQGAKLTFTTYFIRAAVHALQAVPEVNSRWHDDGLEIFSACNIGIATAIDDGLIVPVLKNVEKLDLLETAKILEELVERARQGKINQSELEAGTFTITNHGVSGSLLATPIIHQPQSAILGIGKLEQRVSAIDNEIVIRPKLFITLTIDHRALDGFKANAFLSAYTHYLEHIDNYL